jgi:lysyl-tRNA synthetase, class II
MAEYNSLEKIRLQKVEELRAEGVEPYPTRAQRTHTSVQAIAEFEAGEANNVEVKATLAGRIRSMRPKGKLTFAHIEDGSGKVQLFLRVNEVGEANLDFFNRMFDLGDFVEATGVMFRTKAGEVSLHVHTSSCLPNPLHLSPLTKT